MVSVPKIPDGSRSDGAQYTIVNDHRNEVQAALNEQRIGNAVYHPKPFISRLVTHNSISTLCIWSGLSG